MTLMRMEVMLIMFIIIIIIIRLVIMMATVDGNADLLSPPSSQPGPGHGATPPMATRPDHAPHGPGPRESEPSAAGQEDDQPHKCRRSARTHRPIKAPGTEPVRSPMTTPVVVIIMMMMMVIMMIMIMTMMIMTLMMGC
jgi:flagellar basal body-associated protein FliL